MPTSVRKGKKIGWEPRFQAEHILQSAGDEGNLRKRIVAQLEQDEGRIGTIEQRIDTLKAENTQHQATIDAELAALNVDETPVR